LRCHIKIDYFFIDNHVKLTYQEKTNAFFIVNDFMSYLSLKKYEYRHHGKSDEEYLRRFNSDDSIKIGLNINSYPAFFVETKEIRQKLSVILKLDKYVSKLCFQLPKEALAHYMLYSLFEEIQITNSIEGVQSTKKELMDAYYHNGTRFNGIVGKYHMLISKDNIPLDSCRDIRNLYDELVLQEVLEVSKDYKPDGEIFRKDRTYIRGAKLEPIHEGLYPEEKIIDSMTNALAFLNNEDQELLYRVAVFHYLLGYIHPFYDGNGRLNRFISSYMLTRELEPIIGYSLSNTIKEEQSLYNRTFNECNDKGNRGELTMFVYMFLDIVHVSISNLIDALESRSNSWKRYEDNISKLPFADQKFYSKLYKVLILNKLFAPSRIEINELKKCTNISIPTLRNLLKSLDNVGLLITDKSERSFKYEINLDKMDQLLS